MKYVCLIYHEETALAAMPREEFDALRGRYMAFTQSVLDGGQLVAGEALQPTHTATTVRIRHGQLTTTDGPCVETGEQVGGFYLIEARDRNEAIQIAARIPGAHTGGVEVRPVVDFSEADANADA
ncbi:MAG: YciI family protein [Gemmatimonadaceae bacterium]|nr:YciI family protein [Gemmatimonadaceae bacterium]